MRDLIVTQHLNSGLKRIWRLKSDIGHYTFGSSRTADLFSPDDSLKFWDGFFEIKDKNWYYLSLDPKTLNSPSEPTIEISSDTKIQFSNSLLTFIYVERDLEVNQFQLSPPSASTLTKKYQIYQVLMGAQHLETQILNSNKKFFPKSIPGKISINPIPSSSWHVSTVDDYTIKQKTIDAEKPRSIGRLKPSEILDADSARGIILTALFSVFIIGSYILIPKTEKYIPVSKKAVATRVIVTENLIKKEKPAQPTPVVENKMTAPTDDSKVADAGDSQPNKNKVAGMLKGFNSSRISNLLSKVSAQNQKGKTVIVSEGVLAGSGQSGRALASLGKVEKSGGDWSQDSASKGFKVSTNGLGGGKSVTGFAQLSGGKVGKGGVGLIEDESEVVGGLDREEIANYIKTQLGQILYCYERQLSANKDLFGKVSIKFTISGSGKVETQTVSDTTLKNAMVEGCMLNKIAGWKFPTPRGGTKVIVTYPFLFKSTN